MNHKMLAHFEHLNEASAGSDRVCGIVLGAAVQDALKDALIAVLLKRREHSGKLLSHDGPLGNWGLMNDLAHSMGLVSDDVWNDLNRVREMRNKFAHWGTAPDSTRTPKPVTFQTEYNKERAKQLKCPDIHPPLDFGTGGIEGFKWPAGGVDAIPRLPPPTDPRQRFEITCKCLVHLCGRIEIHYRNPKAASVTFDYPVLHKAGDLYEPDDSSSTAQA